MVRLVGQGHICPAVARLLGSSEAGGRTIIQH
jgi:hypothetical protein